MLELSEVTNSTGCPSPCHYTHYSLSEPPTEYDDQFNNQTESNNRISKFGFMPGRKLITKKTEVLVYPLESFVAEFGGGLGLFLGFSFISLWDLLELVILYLSSNKK